MNAPRVDTEYPFCTSVSVNEDTVFSFWVVELSSEQYKAVAKRFNYLAEVLSEFGDYCGV